MCIMISPRKRNKISYSDEIAARSSTAGWWAALLNVAILVLTVEVVRLNRINVYLNSQNVANNRASAKSGEAMLGELKEINKALTRVYQQ